ncbi:uncharacterized protein At4g00950-like isoform X1 [Neltuma alba]|uniref:uncharacterized protein At4g00950-like isoform X1 n=1 Tax=Neltuma alba TaxID=207710 RepID=UPI0010A3160D|nr:uncharacterized protein At4g00950-like isoform X1 [Prosopis alba]
MDSEAEAAEQSSTTSIPVLPLILFSSSSVSTPPSPEPSGTVTSPLHSAAAAVPFRWEKEPGKPKHSTAIVPFSSSSLSTTALSPKSLELPPRLLTVENPPRGLGSSNRFRSPSWRAGPDCYGSFRADRGRIPVRAVVRSRRWVGFGAKQRWFGSWRMKKREVSGGSYVFPSCGADNRETSDVDAIGGTRKNRGKTKRSGLWVIRRIWEGLKQMGVRRSKALKKDEYALSL